MAPDVADVEQFHPLVGAGLATATPRAAAPAPAPKRRSSAPLVLSGRRTEETAFANPVSPRSSNTEIEASATASRPFARTFERNLLTIPDILSGSRPSSGTQAPRAHSRHLRPNCLGLSASASPNTRRTRSCTAVLLALSHRYRALDAPDQGSTRLIAPVPSHPPRARYRPGNAAWMRRRDHRDQPADRPIRERTHRKRSVRTTRPGRSRNEWAGVRLRKER